MRAAGMRLLSSAAPELCMLYRRRSESSIKWSSAPNLQPLSNGKTVNRRAADLLHLPHFLRQCCPQSCNDETMHYCTVRRRWNKPEGPTGAPPRLQRFHALYLNVFCVLGTAGFQRMPSATLRRLRSPDISPSLPDSRALCG